MLLGEHRRTIDPKGRIILPKEYRQELGPGLIVTKGLDNCLFIYPLREWEKLVIRIEQLPSGDASTRVFTRLFFANASPLSPDGQGRIMIPAHLRKMADLNREVVIAGLANKAEVWNPDNWEKYGKQHEDEYEQSASDIGI
jgi:MraZ protein